MDSNIELLVKVVATLITVGSSITLAWKGRSRWEPSEEDLPKGAQRVVGLFIAVSITLLWVIFFDVSYFNLLVRAILYLVILTFIFFIVYGILISVFTYTKKNGKKVIGGYKLKTKALALKQVSHDTTQQIFKQLNYDVDQVWTRVSRSLAKATFTICYILLILCGTLSISTAAVIFIIKTNTKTSTPVDKDVLNIGFVLNGNASYAQEAMEGFKNSLNKLLDQTNYSAHYEHIVGFAESEREQENLKLIDELIGKFQGKPDYIVPIGTEVTKVVKKNFLNKIPIVFTAISYPVDDGIVKSYDADPNRGNMSGVAYDDPAKNLLEFLRTTFPKKTFGFIYNPVYKQDLSMYKRLTAVAADLNIKVACISTDTVKLNAGQLSKANIFFGRYFLLTRLRQFIDNNEIPFIGNDLLFVKQGALACLATPGSELGSFAAEEILYRNLIHHISLSDIPILKHKNPRSSFNLKAARKYNVTVSSEAIDAADLVIK